jgi:Protein of unknown function (DUF3168)
VSADLDPALRAFLLADAGIAAAVAERIYPVRAPQGSAVPLVVYRLIGEDSDYHMGGASGLVRQLFQLDTYAAGADAAAELAGALRTRLDGFRGPMADVRVQGVFFQTEDDATSVPAIAELEAESEGGAPEGGDLARVRQEYSIVWEER